MYWDPTNITVFSCGVKIDKEILPNLNWKLFEELFSSNVSKSKVFKPLL